MSFLPYISENFAKEYIIPNYIGESMSSLLPGLLSIAQGSIKDEECFNSALNSTYNNGTNIMDHSQLNFSVSVYFLLMFALLCLSIISFSLINFLKISIKQRKIQPMESQNKQSQSYNLKNSKRIYTIDSLRLLKLYPKRIESQRA